MKIGLLILGILFLIKTFLFELYIIPSQSMFPSLITGDIIIVKKYNNDYQSGDVIVFKEQQGYNYIKRIIALPNESIEFNTNLHINEQEIKPESVSINPNILFLSNNHSFFKERKYTIARTKKEYSTTTQYNIPNDCYYVLGDNRDESEDSRNIGCIEKRSIKGKAEVIVFNLNIPRYSEIKSFFMIWERIGNKIN